MTLLPTLACCQLNNTNLSSVLLLEGVELFRWHLVFLIQNVKRGLPEKSLCSPGKIVYKQSFCSSGDYYTI